MEPWSDHISDLLQPAASFDGARIALALANSGELDIYVVERGQPVPLRLSTGGDDCMPAWSPDGRRVIWNSGREGDVQLYWRAADGSDEEERLTSGPEFKRLCSFTPDGKAVAFTAPTASGPETNSAAAGRGAEQRPDDIWILPLAGDRVPYVLISTRANEQEPQFSPDGRWLAYHSDETGRSEIWVQFVNIDGPKVKKLGPSRQVSTTGGTELRWSRDSRELFYRQNQSFFAVTNQSPDSFQPGPAKRMFDGEFGESWAVENDGQHFLMLQRAPEFPRAHAFHYIEHWAQDVRRKLDSSGEAR